MFGLNKIIRPFFSNVFIAVNIDENLCFVKVLRLKEGRVIEDFDREFKIIGDELPVEMIKFIKNYKRRFPFSYVGVISKTYNQGVFHIKKLDEIYKIGIEPSECRVLKFKNWCAYIKRHEIIETQRYFSRFGGVDFIFSPFILAFLHIQKELDQSFKLYVLYERSNIALFIANEAGVYFGGYFMVEGEVGRQVSDIGQIVEEERGALQDDPYSLDEFENLDLGFIQDEDEEDAEVDQNKDANQTIDDITKASIIVNIIQSSLNEFYTNDFYDENFVEEIIFLDNVKMSSEMLTYIQNVTMLETKRQHFFLQEQLLMLIQKEFGNK
ncbi:MULTISPECIES: hypothetical protein [unclassified Helicobacter]|uniref:hypothetical protein n=1 Tax=unclassified Helicobacter TaxID=2593540 RepID=UPI000CF13677|nr:MULTISPECIES: hypothetical protein [unclassified Helicobacter]